MALQSSGQISFSNIVNEFGQPPGKNLGAYRVRQSVGALSNLGLDNNDSLNATIPQSGTIKFSDFYGKKLNIIVNYHTGGTETQPQNGYQRYQANNVTVIGGFKGRPSDPNGKKVYIHVNKKIINRTSDDQTRCALKTGQSWNGAELRVDVGGSGKIFGAGGKGGRGHEGGRSDGKGGNGGDGNSALGLTYSAKVNIMSGGAICGGGGGGGGGGGARQVDSEGGLFRRRRRDRRAGGGGGGGGAGDIPGAGGDISRSGGRHRNGQKGQPGSEFSGGAGGAGGNNDGEARAGRGGNGGGNGNPGEAGTPGVNRGEEFGRGGAGGKAGSAIRIRNASIISLTNNGTLSSGVGDNGIA